MSELTAPYSWQQATFARLQQRLRAGHLMQAILITGLPGVGKVDFARELAKTGLCQRAQAEQQSCGQCVSCRQVAAGAHPDLIELQRLEDKREILIDQVRAFCGRIPLTAGQGGARFGLILGADQLNLAAANALLKTLEEPPPGVTLLLTADQLARIPATIRSRCSRVAIPRPDPEQAASWLQAHGIEAVAARRRIGPCALRDADGTMPTERQESDWAALLSQLLRNGDCIAAAQAVGEAQFDAFIGWWQEYLLAQMTRREASMRMRRLWDALIGLRRQGHLNFNRLLALEGLFILYLRLATSQGGAP